MKAKQFLWVIVRTDNPKMPQASFFFDIDRNREDAAQDAREYVRMAGFTPVSVDFKFTGTFFVDGSGLIKDL